MSIGLEQAKAVGLSEDEWEFLKSTLERLPSLEELQMIGVQWSEHCSYKSSKHHLKKLYSTGEHVLQGPGENAGLVRLDDRRALAFKVESHNHPSYVEPFQGAATGVGGILRDIFTVGARPVALGNYLRFGDLEENYQQHLFDQVVEGISHYGNAIGIPNLGGQIHCHSCYQKNILVNVFALGIVRQKKVFLSNTAKADQSVMIWGAKTGRDGIHGASLLASADFDEKKQKASQQKIRVQVGDPFQEKCLMEACLECMEQRGGQLTAIQDMGAAGLTCSSLEISDKSQIGMLLQLDQVPVREGEMQAYELLLSESQERMLAVVEKGSEQGFKSILHRWGCEAEVIGETISEPYLKVRYHGEQCVNLPVSPLMNPPEKTLPPALAPEPLFEQSQAIPEIEDVRDEWQALKQLLQDLRIKNKSFVYEKYDSSVGARTLAGPGEAEAAVISLGDAQNEYLGVAFKGAWDEEIAKIDMQFAAKSALAECYRGLSCVGAEALAVTDGVNMGNADTEEVQTALSDMVIGMNEAMEFFNTPCVSGNVSLYNQTQTEDGPLNILPTVIMVMVGKIEDVRLLRPLAFQKAKNEVWLIQSGKDRLQFPFGSLYARRFLGEDHPISKALPFLDLAAEKRLSEAVCVGLKEGLFESIRDVSDGGVITALAESCLNSQETLGFDGDWSKSQSRRDYLLFHEGGGRIVVEVEPGKRAALVRWGLQNKLETTRLGSLTAEPNFRLRPLLMGDLCELKASHPQ